MSPVLEDRRGAAGACGSYLEVFPGQLFTVRMRWVAGYFLSVKGLC